MLHAGNPIIKHQAGLLNLAEELVDEGGIAVLNNKSRRVLNEKNRIDEATEQAVISYAIEQPAHGQHRTSNELRKKGMFVSGSGVSAIWLRHNLEKTLKGV